MLKERAEAKQKLEEEGWWYKITQLDTMDEEEYGPFLPEQMEDWLKGGFFEDQDNRVLSFIRNKDKEQAEWQLREDIEHFA